MTDNDSLDSADEAVSKLSPTMSRRQMLGTLLGAGAFGKASFGGGSGTARAMQSADAVGGHQAALELVPTDRVTHTATSSGRWDDASTWDNGVPGLDARVRIPADITVTLDSETARLHWLRNDGTYRVDPSSDSHLRVETVVTTAGSTFEVGTDSVPVSAGVTARTTFLDRGAIDTDYDPGRRSRGLITVGAVSIHGTEKTAWRELASFPAAGETQLELHSEPAGWQPGDRLVVAPVDDPETDDVVEVESVNGSTISLSESIEHAHVPPHDDLPVHVANLTRNVRFESESTDISRRGHVMFMTDQGVTVENAGLYDLGRTDKSIPLTNPGGETEPGTNPKARYALHFHETGVDRSKQPHVVRGCAVDGSPGWGIVNHHSFVEVTDCVTYDVLGSGFVTEGGDEQGLFRRNIAIKGVGSGENVAYRANEGGIDTPSKGPEIDDFGHSGHGFWMHSPGVVVEDNVAAGHADFGFYYWGIPLDEQGITRGDQHYIRFGVMTPANYPKEYGTFNRNDTNSSPEAETDTHIAQGYVTIRSFKDNSAYGVGSGVGLRWMKPQHHSAQLRHTNYEDYNAIENFTVYGVHRDGEDPFTGGNGIAPTWSTHVWIKNCRLVGTGTGRGINRGDDWYAISNIMVQDTVVERFQVGVCASPGPEGIITGCTLDNERTNVRSLAGDMHKNCTLWLNNNTYSGAQHNLFRHFVFKRCSFKNFFDLSSNPDHSIEFLRLQANKNNVRLDDKKLYFDFQLPDAKPFETVNQNGRIPEQESELAAAWQLSSDFGGDFENTPVPNELSENHEELVGKTNRQLDAEYGIKASGTMVPDDAERTDFVRRAWETPAEGTDVAGDSGKLPPALPGMVIEGGPTASIDGPSFASPGETVTFTADAFDPDGDTITTYEWRVADTTTTGPETTHTFEESGSYTVNLTVTNDAGQQATARHTIEVSDGGTAPVQLRVTDATIESDTTVPVRVVADGVPDGIAALSVTVSLDNTGVAAFADASVPLNVGYTDFDIAGDSVTIDLLDREDRIEPGQTDVTIAELSVEGKRSGTANVDIAVDSITDDDGRSVDPSTISGTVTVDTELSPVEDGLESPSDPDGDGKFEDVNGNGALDYDDVVTLSENMNRGPVADNVGAFDFTSDGQLDTGDLVALLEEL